MPLFSFIKSRKQEGRSGYMRTVSVIWYSRERFQKAKKLTIFAEFEIALIPSIYDWSPIEKTCF